MICQLPSFETDVTTACENTICAIFTKACYCGSSLLVFVFVLFLRKRNSIYTVPYSAAVPKKNLPWEVPNRKANTQVSKKRSKVKQTEVYRNMLTMTEGFNNAQYLKNCIASSCRYESYLCPQLKAQVKH